jgi:hypothetical protein
VAGVAKLTPAGVEAPLGSYRTKALHLRSGLGLLNLITFPSRRTTTGIGQIEARRNTAADDCFACPDVTELTIELATEEAPALSRVWR